jgi:hypothetical protein
MTKFLQLGPSPDDGVVVELGLRFTPGARENLGSNPSDPTNLNSALFSQNKPNLRVSAPSGRRLEKNVAFLEQNQLENDSSPQPKQHRKLFSCLVSPLAFSP